MSETKSSGGKVRIKKLDLSIYTKQTDLKNATGVGMLLLQNLIS